MATSTLLLLKPIDNLGSEGDEVTVKAGYARNFLLPRKFAIPVTRANRKQIDALRERAEERRAKELGAAEETAEKLRGLRIAIAVKTGPGGRVFGAVTAQNLIDRIGEDGVKLDRKMVHLYNPIKSLGQHTTRIKLHADVAVDFEFDVVSENPIQDEDGQVIETTEAAAETAES